MRVQQIRISNILGIEELEIAPGAITVVEGHNGSGKTSTLEAIKSVVSGGHDATLLRAGAESGEVVLVLEDGTELRKRITAHDSKLTARAPHGGAVGKPKALVDSLTDALSVNPVSFLVAPPKKRAEYLLESAPLRVSRQDLARAVGDESLVGSHDIQSQHALEVIERVRRALYDERTGVNRAAKEKRATVAQLGETLPAQPTEGDAINAAELRGRLEDARRGREQRLSRLRADRDRELVALREETHRRIEQIKAEAEAAAEAIRRGAEEQVALVEADDTPAIEALSSEIATAEARERQAAQAETTRRIIDGITAEVESLEGRAQTLTRALEGLETLKAQQLARLPMGAEVRDGEIYRDGIPFDRWNRAEQVKFAINLAAVRAGELKLICVDGLECLDEQTFQLFRERAAKSGLQLIVTRVSDTPFAVQTEVAG